MALNKSQIASFLCLTVGLAPGCADFTETVINRSIASGAQHSTAINQCSDCDEIRQMFIVDMHADSFLHGQKMYANESIGHLDLKRLQSAGVDLQIFSMPSVTHYDIVAAIFGRNRSSFFRGRTESDSRFRNGPTPGDALGGDQRCVDTERDTDLIGDVLFPLRGYAGASSREIVYVQARRFCDATGGTWIAGRGAGAEGVCKRHEPRRPPRTDRLYAIEQRRDLEVLLSSIERIRQEDPNAPTPVGAMLSLEGMNWIPPEADKEYITDEVEALYRASVRMIGLTHKYSNNLGGSDEDCTLSEGLTRLGEIAAGAVLAKGMILDLAHLSASNVRNEERTDALDIASTLDAMDRVAMSHGGIGTFDCRTLPRNLPEFVVKELIDMGVPFGVIHWNKALCTSSDDADAVYARIVSVYRNAVRDYGVESATQSLALGSDFDGGIKAPYDVRGVPLLLSRLRDDDWCYALGEQRCLEAIRNIAGQNVLNFLLNALR